MSFPPPSGPYGPPPGNPYMPPGAGNAGPPGGYPPSRPGGPAFQTVPGGMPPSYGPPGNPPSYGPPGGAPPSYGPPGGAPSGPPAGYGGAPTYAPPSSYPAYGAPSGPPSGAGPPASLGYGGPTPPAPKVGFFNPSGGAAVPAPAVVTPPSTMGGGPPMGGMGGPPMGPPPPMGPMGGGPPMSMGAPLSMPPPPTGVPGYPGMGPGPGMGMPGMGGMGGPMGGPPAPPAYQMPHGFESGGNLAAQGGPGGINDGQGAPLPTLEEMDTSVVCNPTFLRSTVSKLVSSQSAATACRVPLGLVCKPMAGDKGNTNPEIEVVDFGSTGIIRCKRCRTYINPYVSWHDNGRRWRCNICGMLNDVPTTYFSHLDNNGRRRDRDQRPELRSASVEFIAPGDYMVRPPQPAAYFFVIDVSEAGQPMLESACKAIKSCLDNLPGAPRTQIGFITFDSQIHFYSLKSTLSAPQMLVIPDLGDVILPLPEDLLVNLNDSRAIVEQLLDSLPVMFRNPSGAQGSATGTALQAAKRVIQHIGGKLVLFQSCLPSLGEGALKSRENPRLLGTDKEHTLLVPEDGFYKTQAIDFSRLQIAIDVFMFAPQYTDVATLATLAEYTAGTAYYYPAFFPPRDGAKFESELIHNLTRAVAFEAVMRVRATRGVRFPSYYGNHFIRGTDLMALPNCTSDSTFTMDIAYDEPILSASVITIQAALLYTNSNSERRIRVHTMILPVTNNVLDMVETLDVDCAMNLFSKQAVDIACKTGFENARQRVHQTTVEIIRGARQAAQGSSYGNQAPRALPNSLQLLPLYSMSLQKSLILRGSTDVRVDERAFFQHLLLNMDIEESKTFIYPRMFSIHDMPMDAGLVSDGDANAEEVMTAGHVRLPALLNLSYERLNSAGLFLLENSYEMFLWIGRQVNPAIISTLFGVPSLDGVDISKLAIQPENSDFSTRVMSVITALRSERSRYMQLHFIREGEGYSEAYFARYLIEDRANFSGAGLSYTEYHAHVNRSVGI